MLIGNGLEIRQNYVENKLENGPFLCWAVNKWANMPHIILVIVHIIIHVSIYDDVAFHP